MQDAKSCCRERVAPRLYFPVVRRLSGLETKLHHAASDAEKQSFPEVVDFEKYCGEDTEHVDQRSLFDLGEVLGDSRKSIYFVLVGA